MKILKALIVRLLSKLYDDPILNSIAIINEATTAPVGANPTLRHLPIRLADDFSGIQDPYIHQIIVHLNTAIEDLYIINQHLNSEELDELLRRRFPL